MTGHDQHEAARAQDVADVALDDAVVDDVGVELGQVQVRDRLDRQQDQDQHERPPVGGQVLAEQVDHRVASWVGLSGVLAFIGWSSVASASRRAAPAPHAAPSSPEESVELVVGQLVQERSRAARGGPRRRRRGGAVPDSVRATRMTRRSSSSRRRSTRPRCSMRSTMPVALAWDTSSESGEARPSARAPRSRGRSAPGGGRGSAARTASGACTRSMSAGLWEVSSSSRSLRSWRRPAASVVEGARLRGGRAMSIPWLHGLRVAS